MSRENGAANVPRSRPADPANDDREPSAGAGVITFGIVCCALALAAVVAVALAAV